MQFNHDNMVGVHLAVDLVDLDADGRWHLPEVTEALAAARVDPAGLVGSLHALRDWTRRLAELFATDDLAERCDRVNELLDASVRRVFLTMHDGLPPHLHFAGDEETLLRRVQALTAGGLAFFSVETGGRRFGICARPGCDHAFADTTRNGRRAYCSAGCGNHHAVQRYRQRGAAAGV